MLIFLDKLLSIMAMRTPQFNRYPSGLRHVFLNTGFSGVGWVEGLVAESKVL